MIEDIEKLEQDYRELAHFFKRTSRRVSRKVGTK